MSHQDLFLPHGNIQSNQSFGLLNVFMTEEELAIEITQINCVQINNVYFPESCKHQVFQQLTSNSSGTNEQDAGLATRFQGQRISAAQKEQRTCLMRPYRAPRACRG